MVAEFSIVIVIILAALSARKDIVNRFFLCSCICVFFIPYEIFSQSAGIGFISKISPFSLFIFSFYFFTIFLNTFHNPFSIHKSVIPLLVLFLYVVLLTASNGTGKGFGTIIDNYLAVLLACNFLALHKARMGEINVKHVLSVLLFSSFIILFEFLISYNAIYYYIFSESEWAESQWWFDSYRSTGGIGHPLIVSTIYLIFLPIVFNLHLKLNAKVFLYFIFISTIVATGSRAAFILAFAFSVYLVFKKNKLNRSLVFFAVAMFFTFQLYIFGFFDSLLYRMFNSEGSTAVRLALFGIIDDIFAVGFIGNGIGTTADFVAAVDFYNAIEITWASFIIETGFLGLLLFIYSWLYFLRHNHIIQQNASVIFLLFIMVSSYNSLVVHTPIMFIFSIFAFLNYKLLSSHKKFGNESLQ
jgi:hypothetical protein